ncbi:autophagy-related protein [Apiospora kogelbergensis]|uniref:Autophagy-related protein 101 n=1 Tax=Apiospora kogelbergensis TaxID=1337665 RepID=A0AAW0QWQ8_9PEZI
MDPQQNPQEFILDAFVDPTSVRDVVGGILHTIFFHRFFPSLVPETREVLGLSVPYVNDAELDTMIAKRTSELHREVVINNSHHHSSNNNSGGGGRGTISVQFLEKKRRKTWYMRPSGDEEVCWERWTVKVTVAEPKTETERAKVRNAMETTLRGTVLKIVDIVNQHKDHIPPITTTDANPFPYQIVVNQKEDSSGWATRIGIY